MSARGADFDVQPVERESTAGIIARQLRSAITSGSLPAGSQLGEADLASRFQVSRGPLREAMQRLVQEGLLRSEPHRGLFVIDLEPGDIYDIYSARVAVESAATTRVIRGGLDGAVRSLRAVHARMAEAADAEDPHSFSVADLEFHETLVAVSGSRRLVRMMRTLMVETRMCLSALQHTYTDLHGRFREHAHLIDAVEAFDEPLALALLERHMEDAVRRLAPGTSLLAGTAPHVPDGGVDLEHDEPPATGNGRRPAGRAAAKKAPAKKRSTPARKRRPRS